MQTSRTSRPKTAVTFPMGVENSGKTFEDLDLRRNLSSSVRFSAFVTFDGLVESSFEFVRSAWLSMRREASLLIKFVPETATTNDVLLEESETI